VTARLPVGLTIGNSREDEIYSLRDDYVRAVGAAGGLPFVLAPGNPEDAAELASEYLDRVEALVLSGGADVDPALYGEERHAMVGRVFPERDAFELALCREALRRDVPTLAICRGHQLLNVATGGTLFQDIASQVRAAAVHDPDQERWERCHDVEVLPGTRLFDILGQERVAVNSFHHQAVKELGRGLVLSARGCDDGVIEAMEMPDRRFMIGVQWHPESFWDKPHGFQPLFQALVDAAR
jgi:putative glutamine amidotransferase